MSRRHRLVLAGVALGAAAAAVMLFTAFSTVSEGPIGAVVEGLATSIRSLEYRIRERTSAPGRSRQLAWFAPHRVDVVRLRNPDRVLLGAFTPDVTNMLQGVFSLEKSLVTTLPLVQLYTAWGDKAEHRFPRRIATTIWNMGSVPVITWEPWLSVFDNVRHPHLPLRDARDVHGLDAVARGGYDFYVDAWAADAARFARPLFVRFAHEMNDPYRYPWGPQHNTKEEFIAAWRHVVDRFRLAGATNVVWVWSPHVAYEYWDLYYPGTEYVDWVATGVLNFGPIAHWSRWWTFDEIFGSKYERMCAFGKPLMIAEFGSLGVGGDRRQWYRDALERLPARYPALRALLFFEVPSDRTVTYQAVDWSVQSDPDLVRTISQSIEEWPDR